MNTSLAPYAIFAGMLAMAGLPIYIHAPKFYVDEFGVSLAALGAVLYALRLIDVVRGHAAHCTTGLVCDHAGAAVFGLQLPDDQLLCRRRVQGETPGR